jgi:TPP-dependent pyruvate/acetoin dehydrogenase alpha subunit
VCFFGDGTTNIGAFHEALNFAAVWKLPVIFVCENNLYMEYTPIGDVTAVQHPAADRAAAYGLERIVVDGNDADAVYRSAETAYEKARAPATAPSLIECMTYRHSGHSRADPAKYRPEGELEKWKERDPIKIYRERLKQFGIEERHHRRHRADVKRKSMRRPKSARRRRRRRSISSPPTSMPMEASHGGTDLSRRRRRGIAQEMARDPDVVFLGEDVAKAGGVFKATVGLCSSSSGRRACATRRSPSRHPRRRHGRGDDRP